MKTTSVVLSALLLSTAAASASAAQVFITNFTKSDNIYTNLNEQFPATSNTGVPGSAVGAANASFLFDPSSSAVQTAGYAPNYIVSSNLVNNGIDFELTSDASGHDFEEINSGPGITIPVNTSGVQTVYALVGAYNGQSATFTFIGADATTQVFSNVFIPDFNGGTINSTSAGLADQTLFQVHDVGAGGSGNSTTGDTNNYDLTELAFTLQPSLANQQLSSITVTSNGFDTLLLGVTLSTSPVPEPTTLSLAAFGAAALLLRRRPRSSRTLSA